MPPLSGDVAQTPEPKTGGLASVFKSFTGGKSSKTTAAAPTPPPSVPSATVQRAHDLYASSASRGAIYGGPTNYEHLYQQLKAGKALSDRVAAADALRIAVLDYPLTGVTSIWYAGKDLIDLTNPQPARYTGFQLLTSCVKHDSATDLERKEYFDTLTAVLAPEDFHLQLAAVIELARHGKDLAGFHYDAVPLLTRWLKNAYIAFEVGRKQSKPSASKSSHVKAPSGEETNLQTLFDFIVDVIKFSFNVATEDDTGRLIDEVLAIAHRARSSKELGSCIRVLDSIVTYGEIPNTKLRDCIKVLCAIHCIVRDIREEAWRTISNLCKSHNGHATVTILLDILRYPQLDKSSPSNLREIRGALAVLEKIAGENAENGFPVVPFSLLMDALSKLLALEHAKVESDILKLILAIFIDENENAKDDIMDEDWSLMFEIATKCSARVSETSDGRLVDNNSHSISPSPNSSVTENPPNPATSMAQQLYRLITKTEEIMASSPTTDFLQRENCVTFFARVHAHLPPSCAKLVIEYYVDARFCYPSDPEWKANIQILLDAFFNNRARPSQIRLQALKAVADVYEMIAITEQDGDPDYISNFVLNILKDLAEETDVVVLREVVAFAVTVAETADADLFDLIMKQLHLTVSNDRFQSPLSPPATRIGTAPSAKSTPALDGPPAAVTPSNIITRGLIQIFMKSMDKTVEKALRAFDEILWIAKSSSADTDARISAMKMLFRLRADWANRVFLTTFTESDGLASSLYRTAPSLARKQAEDEAASHQTRTERSEDSSMTRAIRTASSNKLYTLGVKPASRAVSGLSRALQRNNQMWMTPDPDALPEFVSAKASTILASLLENPNVEDAPTQNTRQLLKVNVWLETVISLLQQGCDWEIYSYILVHLASQLTNHALFKSSVPQIKELRRLICDQIKNNSFHEPPLSSGLRKADVAICLFQILTMLVSYHQHFNRNEQDEIVKAFVQGVTTWERAAKGCIHALSICCHELPSSMRLALFNTLQKMSQIITQAHVAVHILEFLACLARLPELYSNFREDEYRFVFGICFRYLQYVRERSQDAKVAVSRNSTHSQKQSGSTPEPIVSNMSDPNLGESNLLPNASDDLPQYVYALAYHVITFWFLSLRLSDRASQVSWIIKNLVWTDASGRQHVDEQAQVTMDFMQRTAYANVDESRPDPEFTEAKHGQILKRRWVIGQSIITIEQSNRGDLAQITKRQPSASCHYMIHERFVQPPAHQTLSLAGDTRHAEVNAVFPNYLMLQLTGGLPLTDATRPIPLPDDDMVRRAISSFDRISTVDGHKVGVIYVGENQTHEVQILSNVMGSSDYTEFLSGLGTLTKLEGATFNTQGLDRVANSDGEYTFCWRDRVTEIVFHVTTLMPTNLDADPQCIGKKRHIGNDFVNIIFNNSGLPFDFNTFPSEFNFVNIVITPESRASFVATRLRSGSNSGPAFYKVQVMSKPGFPEISPAAETKILGLKALPEFIRLLALNASVFSLVWANREGGEHVSSWRSRLRAIETLRERYGKHSVGSTISPPGTSQGGPNGGSDSGTRSARESMMSMRRGSVATFATNTSETHDRTSKTLSTTETDALPPTSEETMVASLDFSRWA